MPLLIVNFKSYNVHAVELARMCAAVSSSLDIIVAPSLVDLAAVRAAVDIPVFSQHVDVVSGAHTGHVTVSSIKAAGASGTLINHSERPVSLEHIQKAVHLCSKNGLKSVVCAPSIDAIRNIVEVCTPDYIAYEPPELIGGNISVTSAKPDIVRKAVEMVKGNTKMLCGAGIKTGRDVKMALDLGCAGVLVSSAVVNAENPKMALAALTAL